MSIEDSPEFKEALEKACEEAYNGYLFGSKRKAKATEKLPPSVAKALKDVERVKRMAEEQKRKAEIMMASAKRRMAAAPFGGFSTPAMPEFPAAPETATGEEMEDYQRQIDEYGKKMDEYRDQVTRQANLMQDKKFMEATERFSLQPKSALTCPKCGDVDHGNRMGKTPWCMKCNVALTRVDEKKGKQRIKTSKKTVPNILRGLPEDEENERFRNVL